MKKIIIIFSFMLLVTSVHAQKKNAKVSCEVDGVCVMCKKRIEAAALKTKGVKFASWDVRTHELKLIIDERKTTLQKVQKNIADAGHDSKEVKATTEAYEGIHPCCKYRSEAVKEEHQKGKTE
ncbi:heavy-metal-associated domain-containing protein [Tenacibaculum maritimum]|uniref:heavy-metal-associated domain-containing protein n=1 Tax=Tenacibaculum maritimum TaxID=107401 RepID=UPI0010A40D17|nr:cation transporter [Tenacibaculum maritimum]MCD9563602.1 cation transporter [Tenacibaculum maritimum]MCD9566852.1 cation transporter [Tenacibaculum maritimum]MCD9580073.1 cation transporter [Tenacibaculum maritimum]MCD9597607.1 cation transporter [Tenacibaculum maritimum]MCD9611620.1 cation transporter [Tenacibaculum maritimum]